MNSVHTIEVPASAERVFSWIDDLSLYPQWLGVVHSVERLEPEQDCPVWRVELRAKLGPLARSKVLRMMRTECDAPNSAVFERSEVDGREHAPWTLRATVDGDAARSSLTMELGYGGRLWGGSALQRVLDDAVAAASRGLLDVVSDEPTR